MRRNSNDEPGVFCFENPRINHKPYGLRRGKTIFKSQGLKQGVHFNTPAGASTINTSDGWEITGMPYMAGFWVDYKRERLYFCLEDQGKRCMKATTSEWPHCSDMFEFAGCAHITFDKTPCSWRGEDKGTEKGSG